MPGSFRAGCSPAASQALHDSDQLSIFERTGGILSLAEHNRLLMFTFCGHSISEDCGISGIPGSNASRAQHMCIQSLLSAATMSLATQTEQRVYICQNKS